MGCGARRGGILSGNEKTIDDHKALPIGSFLVVAAQSLQLILDKERHNIGEVNSFLFSVGKTRHALTLYRLTLLRRKSRISTAILSPSSSRAKCPVSSR